MAGDDVLGLAAGVLAFALLATVWLVALVATAVVWPWREATGRWTVVAYSTRGGPPSRGNEWRQVVKGKANAEALVQWWTENIQSNGEPLADPLPV
jgi:hypothetical protein